MGYCPKALGSRPLASESKAVHLMQPVAGIGDCTELKKLYLGGCEKLVSLPDSEYSHHCHCIAMGYCPKALEMANHAALVAAIGECTQLKEVDLCRCNNLKLLPDGE